MQLNKVLKGLMLALPVLAVAAYAKIALWVVYRGYS